MAIKYDKDSDRLSQIEELEELLYGINYQVTLNLYGPFASDESLEAALETTISAQVSLRPSIPSSVAEMRAGIVDCLLYKGEPYSGPLDLAGKRELVLELVEELFALNHLGDATLVETVCFEEGDPRYPVWWDFASRILHCPARIPWSFSSLLAGGVLKSTTDTERCNILSFRRALPIQFLQWRWGQV